MFKLSTTWLADMIPELEAAIRWLGSMGIATGPKRHATYLRHLNKIEKRWREAGDMRAADVPIEPKRMETSMFEALQLIRIWRAFGEAPPTGLKHKLRTLAGGPELEEEERPSKSGNAARDCAFELEVAAYLSRIGPIDLTGGVDVVTRHRTMPLFVECKRPSSKGMVAENLDRATDAITAELRRTELASYGIPAISVAKADWSGGVVLRGASVPAIRRALTAWQAQFDEAYIQPWFPKQSDGRLAAVLLHIPYIGYVGDSPTMVGVELALIGSRFIQGTLADRDLAEVAKLIESAGE